MDKEYLVFRGGAERTNEVIYTSDKRAAEIAIEENAVLIEWQPVDGDRVAINYITDGSHSPESSAPVSHTYKELRQAEYAQIPIGDQLDAILKYALANGVVPDANQPQDTPEGLTARILAIKEKYPKP